MTPEEERADVAWPGDPDLTYDVAGITITAAVAAGHEIWIHGTGGVGWWRGADGSRVHLPRVDDIDIRLACSDPTDESFRWMVDRFTNWRDRGTGLRITMADGRLGRVGESETEWAAFPTDPAPEWPQ